MATRTVYCCETCQPLKLDAPLAANRSAAMAGAKQHQPFRSHCAPDDPTTMPPAKLTCAELRARLKVLNMDCGGNKAELVARLEAAQQWVQGADKAAESGSGGSVAAGDDGAGECRGSVQLQLICCAWLQSAGGRVRQEGAYGAASWAGGGCRAAAAGRGSS